MPIHTPPNREAWFLFAKKKPEAEGLKDTCGDLVCLQNPCWERSSICSYTRCASQYEASVWAVHVCSWWYLHAPIHRGIVGPWKEPGIQLPSPALLFNNLVNLGESEPLQAIVSPGMWEGWVWTWFINCKMLSTLIIMYTQARIYYNNSNPNIQRTCLSSAPAWGAATTDCLCYARLPPLRLHHTNCKILAFSNLALGKGS